MSDIAAVGEKRVFEPFDKEAFKKEILYNIKYLFRKTPETASQQEIFQAVAYASKDMIIDEWLNAHKEYEKQDAKTVYYLSMEFLMGRALGNNLINLCCYKEVAEVLQEMGLDINVVEDQEPDAALGNGGLGRLAACFIESLSTLNYPAYGCTIRYKYGMFKQQIVNGEQVEIPDDWLIHLRLSVRNILRRSNSAVMSELNTMRSLGAMYISRTAISLSWLYLMICRLWDTTTVLSIP